MVVDFGVDSPPIEWKVEKGETVGALRVKFAEHLGVSQDNIEILSGGGGGGHKVLTLVDKDTVGDIGGKGNNKMFPKPYFGMVFVGPK